MSEMEIDTAYEAFSLWPMSCFQNAEIKQIDNEDIIQATTRVFKENAAIHLVCNHNDRGDTSLLDVVEHVGNGELGSALRDVIESPAFDTASEIANNALEIIGEELLKGEHNE